MFPLNNIVHHNLGFNELKLEFELVVQQVSTEMCDERSINNSPWWCWTFQPSPSSTEDDLLSFPLIVINHIWKNSHDRSAGWWQNTRSHLLSKCCRGQVDSRGRSWRVLVSPLSPSIIATPAHDSLRAWAGKIILPIIHIDLMAAAAKEMLLARHRINHRGQTQNDHIFCFWSYESA